MNISRRALLTGGIVGAATVGTLGYFEGVFDTYKGDVWIKNRRPTSTPVDIVLTDLDDDRVVLDESFTLPSRGEFRKEGVFSNKTQYRVTIQIDGNSTQKEFETCCEGFQLTIYIEREELQVLLGHYD